jgi:Ca2+-binding EF-hand superfamily protein
MSVSPANSNLTQQVWQRFLSKADLNSDSKLDQQELASVSGQGGNADEIKKILETLDQDGDGTLDLGELSAKPYNEHEYRPMIDIQEASQEDLDRVEAETREDVRRLFERADVDGDGRLSRQEWEAELRMNATRYLQGENDSRMETGWFLTNYENPNWEYLTPDDITIPRLSPGLELQQMPDEIVREIQEGIERGRNAYGHQPPPSKEERQAQLRSEVLNKPLTTAYLSRLFAQLANTAMVSEQSTVDLLGSPLAESRAEETHTRK